MEDQRASNRLAKGTMVYTIGKMLSKILQMLILPIITAALSTSDYGYYDLLVTTISLVVPIVTLQVIEGMFRFMFDANEEEKTSTVSTVTFFLLGAMFILGGAIAVIYAFSDSLQYPVLVYINYVSYIIFSYFQKLARCQGKNKQFAIAGVINTFVMLITQVVLLKVFYLKVDGMLIANAISYFAASLYLAYFLNIRCLIDVRKIKSTLLKQLIKYSVPLIPNSLGWWLIASSDKYIISFFLGTSDNGIYSIASKFSQLLTFLTSVFQLAWQESAIMELNSKERNQFYSNTFNNYMRLLLGGYIVVLPFIRIIFPILVSESYQTGYLYVPILLVGAVFSAFSQFYGSAYLVFKKTMGAFYTTISAALFNIIIGWGFINKIGLFAPALGTALSFLFQWIFRAFQLRKDFHIAIDKKSLVILIILVALSIVLYYSGIMIVHIICVLLGSIVFVILNRDFLKKYFAKILRKVK